MKGHGFSKVTNKKHRCGFSCGLEVDVFRGFYRGGFYGMFLRGGYVGGYWFYVDLHTLILLI